MPATKLKDDFFFRDLHPNFFLGTASDRYAGWIEQIYDSSRYSNRVTSREKTVGGKKFLEYVLPVDSVEEYFQHLWVLELDFTFYASLTDEDGKPTSTWHVLHNYSQYLKKEDRLILKAPQAIFAKQIMRQGTYIKNDRYLDSEYFVRHFYQPVRDLVDPWLKAIVFEQEYQRRQDRPSIDQFATEMDQFFESIPADTRYHTEIRTETFLRPPLFKVLERHGIGQALSNWTWLPPLTRQFALSGNKLINKKRSIVIRLMTPRGMRYEEAYAKAHPFKVLVDGMINKQAMDEAVKLVHELLNQGAEVNVIINNRYGGNAPLIAQKIAQQFLRPTLP